MLSTQVRVISPMPHAYTGSVCAVPGTPDFMMLAGNHQGRHQHAAGPALASRGDMDIPNHFAGASVRGQ